jgi:hypothetical protein
MIYDNEKLNEIFRDTWPNLHWAFNLHNTVKENDRQSTEVDDRDLGGETLLG